MKVKELIEKLQQFDGELEVAFESIDSSFDYLPIRSEKNGGKQFEIQLVNKIIRTSSKPGGEKILGYDYNWNDEEVETDKIVVIYGD